MATEVSSISSSAGRIIMAREASLGVLPGSPQYFDIDVNQPSDDFGPTFNLISRRVVNQRRRLRGDIASGRVGAGFQIDFTPTVYERLVGPLFLSTPNTQPNKGTVFDTGLAVTGTGYDVDTDAATAGWEDGHLLYAENFATAANNGLKEVTGTTGDEVEVSGLTAEASPPNTAVIRAVGIQFGSGELDVVKTGGQFPTLVIASGSLDWTNFNIVPGSWIYIDKARGAASNRFVTAANNGYMRVLSVTATTLTVDTSDGGADLATDMASETGTGLSIRVFLSDRTVDAGNESDANFNKFSHFIERQLGIPNPVANPGVIQTEDLFGNVVGDWSISVGAEDKTVMDITLIGSNAAAHTGQGGDLRTTNGATILSIAESGFFNNSSRVVKSIVSRYDETGGVAALGALFQFVTSYELAFSNNAAVLPAVGRTFGFDTNVNGQIADITVDPFFTDIDPRNAISDNDRLQFQIAWERPFNGRLVGVLFDFPSCSGGDGKVRQQIDTPMKMPFSLEASESNEHDQTTSSNAFWFIP